MGIDNLSDATVAQSLNNADVRAALLKKGVAVTENTIFKINGDSIQIDIEGDGVYDKTVSGLFRKDGSINTNHKKIDVGDTDVNTSYIKQQNSAIARKERFIVDLGDWVTRIDGDIQTTRDAKFDEAGAKAKIAQEKAALLDKYNKAKQDLTALQQDYDANHANWTTKQCKDYQRKFVDLFAVVEHRKNAYGGYNEDSQLSLAKRRFDIEKEAKIAAYNRKKASIQEEKAQNEKQLHKMTHAYNDYLNKHGYATVEARGAVKDLKRDASAPTEAGVELGKAETTEATVIRIATDMFKKANPDIKDFDVKYDAKSGAVSISLKDGDTIADYTISGFYNPEKKTLNFDEKKLNLNENANSTRQLSIVNRALNNLETEADQIDYAMEPKKAKSAYGEIDEFKRGMEDAGISLEDVQEYRKQHKQ